MKRRHVTLLMSAFAIYLATTGGLLLFAPQELGRAFGAGLGASPLLQLLGGALIGLGAADWMARQSPLGGIYGRAVVAANQLHFTVGALVLAKHSLAVAVPVAYVFLTAAHAVGAVFFNWLVYGPPPRAE
jgi:hypothetical protein